MANGIELKWRVEIKVAIGELLNCSLVKGESRTNRVARTNEVMNAARSRIELIAPGRRILLFAAVSARGADAMITGVSVCMKSTEEPSATTAQKVFRLQVRDEIVLNVMASLNASAEAIEYNTDEREREGGREQGRGQFRVQFSIGSQMVQSTAYKHRALLMIGLIYC